MKYDFLVDTYDTERLKVVSVWSEFKDEDLAMRPRPGDPRGRSVHEQMVHQRVSEDLWFRNMLGIDVAAPPLPEQETRLAFMRRYAEDSGKRTTGLREKRDLWWEEDTKFFYVARGGLMQNHAPTIYAYSSLDALLGGEAAGGAKANLPGVSGKPVTERPR
jgi:hypothetical protein